MRFYMMVVSGEMQPPQKEKSALAFGKRKLKNPVESAWEGIPEEGACLFLSDEKYADEWAKYLSQESESASKHGVTIFIYDMGHDVLKNKPNNNDAYYKELEDTSFINPFSDHDRATYEHSFQKMNILNALQQSSAEKNYFVLDSRIVKTLADATPGQKKPTAIKPTSLRRVEYKSDWSSYMITDISADGTVNEKEEQAHEQP